MTLQAACICWQLKGTLWTLSRLLVTAAWAVIVRQVQGCIVSKFVTTPGPLLVGRSAQKGPTTDGPPPGLHYSQNLEGRVGRYPEIADSAPMVSCKGEALAMTGWPIDCAGLLAKPAGCVLSGLVCEYLLLALTFIC